VDGTDSSRVEVWRWPYLESVHTFSACILHADGQVIHQTGSIERVYPVRSLAKPFYAAELIRCGAADAVGFAAVEIALAAGSHDGEERHVEGVRRMLAHLDLDESALLCGPAMEGKAIVGPPIANNCSGKHAAVLAICRYFGFSVDEYIYPSHPVQTYLTSRIMPAFGLPFDESALAVDGCGMPIFGASLRQIALAYARFGVATDIATERVRAAMRAEPGYVGGWHENFDSQVIKWNDGQIIAKIGAEGLHADAFVGRGIGSAIKVHDGNSRALPPILANHIRRSGYSSVLRTDALEALAIVPVRNAAGLRVGDIKLGGAPMPEASKSR